MRIGCACATLTGCSHACRMGGRTLNVAYAEPKQHEQQQAQQQQLQAQPKVRRPCRLPHRYLRCCIYDLAARRGNTALGVNRACCIMEEAKGSTEREGLDLAASAQVIYVGNLPNTANETNLKELFDTFSGGEVHLQPMHMLDMCNIKHCPTHYLA